MEEIYLSGRYTQLNPTYHIEDSLWKAEQILKMVKKHNLQPGSVCEIGCGAGEILHQLQTHFPQDTRFFGYEISPDAYQLCKQRENDTLRFFQQDLLAIETEPFDLLLCIDVFEHVEDYMGFLRKLRKKASFTLFHIPLELAVLHVLRHRNLIHQRIRAGHLHYFNKETALLTLQDTGYSVLDWFYTNFGWGKASTAKAKLLKIPRRLLSLIDPDLSPRILGGCSLLVLTE